MAVENKINITVQGIDKATAPLKGIKRSFGGLNDTLKRNQQTFQRMAGIGTAALGALTFGMNKAIDKGVDLGESINALNVVFGEGAETLLDFGEQAATSVGLSQTAFNGLATETGTLLKATGQDIEDVADNTVDLTKRASDLASVFNTEVDVAMSAINQALRGETEAIRKFGSDVTDASLNQYLLSQGINTTTTEMTQQEKVLFRMEKIMADTNQVQGDFANTSDSLANRQRVLASQMENTTAKFGELLIPIKEVVFDALEPLVTKMSEFISQNPELAKNIALGVAALTGLVAVFGTLGLVVPSIITGFTTFIGVIKSLGIALRFLALNPVGLVITAIAGGIAIGVAIVKNWEKIKDMATSLGKKIMELYEKYKIFFAIFAPGIAIGIEVIKNWDKISDTAKRLWKTIEKVLKGLGAGLHNFLQQAKEWGSNLVDMFIAGIKAKVTAIKDAVTGIATTIKDYLGFSSPTKKGPASNSDKWMPNMIKMMEQGLRGGKRQFSRAASEISTVLVNEFGKRGSFNQIQEVLDDLQVKFKQAFSGVKSDIDASKSTIKGLTNEIKGLEDQLKRIDESMAALDASTEKSIAERVVELEKQLQDEDLSREERVAKQKELDFAREKTTLEEIQAIKDYQALNETERILYQAELRREQFEEEKLRIEEELAAKEDALSKELSALAELYAQKNRLEREYHSLYMTNIESRILKTKESIALLERLNAMRESASSGSGGVDGARALGGTVNSGKTYLVGERGPELFTPSSTGNITPNNQLGGQANNITINMGGVTVQNEADEDRLIDKIKKNLIRETQLFNNGIV